MSRALQYGIFLWITDPSDIWACWTLLLFSSSHGESWFYYLSLISKGKLLTHSLPFMWLATFTAVPGGPCPISAALFTRGVVGLQNFIICSEVRSLDNGMDHVPSFGDRRHLAALSIMLWSIPSPSQLLSHLATVVFPQLFYLMKDVLSSHGSCLPLFKRTTCRGNLGFSV